MSAQKPTMDEQIVACDDAADWLEEKWPETSARLRAASVSLRAEAMAGLIVHVVRLCRGRTDEIAQHAREYLANLESRGSLLREAAQKESGNHVAR